MKWISEKLTRYIIKAGAASEELYEVYQYGFQMVLEMLCCFSICFATAIYLHLVWEFLISTGIFMMLRTYAGGVHLNHFISCFLCSITVQLAILVLNDKYQFSISISWVIILISSILIWSFAPVESINRELDKEEKAHCKKVTLKVIVVLLILAGCFTFIDNKNIVSLITFTVAVVFISQCIGIIKYRAEKALWNHNCSKHF